MKKAISIVWFRQDLRISDHPALYHAAKNQQILPIYILDDHHAKQHKMGSASRVWLHHSLKSLSSKLDQKLALYQGDPLEILSQLTDYYHVTHVYWNRCYEPWRIQRDMKIKKQLEKQGIQVQSYNASLLWEPWEVHKKDGTPYKVFTPFYRKGCLQIEPPREPLHAPRNMSLVQDKHFSQSLTSLDLIPKQNWSKSIVEHWNIGEEGARKTLQKFIQKGLDFYKEGRNYPAKSYISRLSPHLHFGEISPNQVWYTACSAGHNVNIDHFCSELGWREFSYSQLYFNPDLPLVNLQPKFHAFPWLKNKRHLTAWQKGQTGIPIVDAGMRELWATGFMHNRVRMIVGSFLVKNLLIDWREGEKWFWDCLFDADLANNSASWQWIAGCGADAAPYFRIFNPVTQGQKFDGEGRYTRKWVPELQKLSDKYLFNPWEAPPLILQDADIQLGKNYPKPIVDLKISRQQALDAFASLK